MFTMRRQRSLLLNLGALVIALALATLVGEAADPAQQADAPGIPYGSMHLGQKTTDYQHPKTSAFNGAFVDLGSKSDAAMSTLLQAARDHGMRIVVNLAASYPCTYWDGVTFDHDQFVADATSRVDNIVPYYPDTVVGIMLINEPHDPQPECKPAIPPSALYNAAREIRSALTAAGLGNIPLGYGSHPVYLEAGLTPAQSRDGTITLSFIQWRSGRGEFATWAAPHKAAAARMSEGGHKHWIAYSVNSAKATDLEVLLMNSWACTQDDAIQVWWWKWTNPSPKETVSLTQFQGVRTVCDAN